MAKTILKQIISPKSRQKSNKQKSQPLIFKQLGLFVVVLPGLEPGNAAPKTVVLPLHYRTILCQSVVLPHNCAAKLLLFSELTNN